MAERMYYLAGPMSGQPDHNFPAFDAAAKLLRSRKYLVTSPAELARELPGEPGSLNYEVYLRMAIQQLLYCTDIIMLPGWEQSRGARLEWEIADKLKFRMWLYSDGEMRRIPHGDSRA